MSRLHHRVFPRARLAVGVGLGVALLSCNADRAMQLSDRPIELTPVQPHVLTGCNKANNYNSAIGGLVQFWNCGDAITFSLGAGATQTMVNSLAGQGTAWNSSVLNPTSYPNLNLPHFGTSPGSGGQVRTIVVTADGQTGSTWCGSVKTASGGDIGPGALPGVINFAPGSCGTMDQVARHELAHVLGIMGNGSAGTDWHKRNPAILGHCAFAINTATLILGQTMCPHLKEIIWPMYGVVNRPVDDSRHIVTGIVGNGGVSVQEGQTASAAPQSLYLVDANYSLCNPGSTGDTWWQPCGDPYVVTTGYSLSYSSNNPSVASVNSSTGLVTANHYGTATITRTVTSLPSQYQTSSVISGGSVTVTVTPAPAYAQITAGNNVTTTPGSTVSPSPTVRILGSDGVTPISGVTVTFGSPSGGSILTGTVQTTNTGGYATVGSWKLGATPGTYTMTATVSASVTPNPLTFTATAAVTQPSAFTVDVQACHIVGPKVFNTLTWNPGAGATYEIIQGTVNDTSQASLLSSGPATTSSLQVVYLTTSGSHYWWLHELSSVGTPTGRWLSNAANGQTGADGCTF
ncbi:MAG TPA: Ig-like domain-containing protein [Gemmatimonadales bacterium]|nr:Ig-like domain-containing protein [Gemmatimonadales bacterium]